MLQNAIKPVPTVETVRGCPASAEIRNHDDGADTAWCAHWQGSDGPMRARIYWHADGRGWARAETVRDIDE